MVVFHNGGCGSRKAGSEGLVLFGAERNSAGLPLLTEHKGGKKWTTKKQEADLQV